MRGPHPAQQRGVDHRGAAEHESFVQLALARPDVLRYYNCVFGDIYLVNKELLPTFDVVALFHLCEFRSELNDAYGALTDREVMDRLTDALKPSGHMLFYTGSDGYSGEGPADTKRLIEAWSAEQPVEYVGAFKSLVVYRKAAPAAVAPAPRSLFPWRRRKN